MGRPLRILPRGTIAHVVNRSVERRTIFHNRADYWAFISLLEEGTDKGWVEVLGYCVMSNHWHLLLRAAVDRGISHYMKWLTATHAIRYRTVHDSLGLGHLYQGRFRSSVIEDDRHFLTVLRYIEANACKAGLVRWADSWEWSSGYERRYGLRRIIGELPVPLPPNWCRLISQDSPALPGDNWEPTTRNG